MLQLFGYWRSSASFRVRLVLQLKGLDYEQHPVNLRQGEQKEKAYRRVNPQGLVPFLVDDDVHLGQSVAIMEYLDETYPAYPLMPSAPIERARVRPICTKGTRGVTRSLALSSFTIVTHAPCCVWASDT
ncbi:glutathione S-transferase N-terminal domain-containing protein, partial [Aeromonas caviae]|uniref:glutathione S-transferase N-terminal domain-containing protein n=1 Tax=Aeromonas caviae TaxID=648 RepID=UPI001CC7BA6E